MAERDRGYLPQSTAGLIRYYEEESGVKIKPEVVIWISMVFAAIILLLRFLV
jgi:preprotein translocase subunit Sec61beta